MRSPMLSISIVTPAFNASSFLRETIDSVLAENYPSLDYVVVDDGSTDDTPAILAAYGARIRVLHRPNSGEQSAVNAGVAVATGDLVAVINADDPIRPGLLVAAAQAFAVRPELVAVYPDWIMIDSKGRERRRVRTFEYVYRDMLERQCCLPGPGTFFRKSALAGAAPRDPALRYSGDFFCWLRLGLRGPMQRLPGFYATWRQHDDGASAGHSAAMVADKISVVERFYAYPDIPDEIRSSRLQAMSAAYYRASQHALHKASAPGRLLLWRSYQSRLIWPWHPNPAMRRSIGRVLFVLAQPLSSWLLACLRGRNLLRKR
jgi:glycosyltransferase involved in cell wall biosynthesis